MAMAMSGEQSWSFVQALEAGKAAGGLTNGQRDLTCGKKEQLGVFNQTH